MSIVYGPVPSWRLGRSLGIDLLPADKKTCTFDCVYCQLGRTRRPLLQRREFVRLDDLAQELEMARGVTADYVTFSGMGEPTLAVNLGEAIRLARRALGLPVAVLTNSSLMTKEDVRQGLCSADVVVAKLDAADEELFQRINRPLAGLSVAGIVEVVTRFRRTYRGRLALQMMFIEANRDAARRMADIAARLAPDEVQVNTPLRPCAVAPLPPEEIAAIAKEFKGIPSVRTPYEMAATEVMPLDERETLRRRPGPASVQGRAYRSGRE